MLSNDIWMNVSRKAGANTSVLFASGYSAGAIHTGFVLHEGMQLIPKPFRRNVLLQKVREALDAKRQGRG